MDPVALLFGKAFHRITANDLTAFFGDAGDEGLTWEAKATDIRDEHLQTAASAFGNSEGGGLLILGAHRPTAGGAWLLPGVRLPGEPSAWVAQKVQAGVAPVPAIDVRVLERGNDPPFVLVWIPPVADPPVVTRTGRVHTRVVSTSPPVTDPSVLARLHDRRRAGRASAESRASDAVAALHMCWPDLGWRRVLEISVATIGMPDGFYQRSLSRATVRAIEAELSHLPPLLDGISTSRTGWQHGIAMFKKGRDEGTLVGVDARGAVSVAFVSAESHGLSWIFADNLLTAYCEVACRLMRDLGGTGTTRLLLSANDSYASLQPQPYTCDKWLDTPVVTDELVGSLQRELQRARGQDAFEKGS